MADFNLIMADFKKGMSIHQLKTKYKLNDTDLKMLNAKIQQALLGGDKVQTAKITLDDGTKVTAAKISTVKQPKGGYVNLYITQDGKRYYQYMDANGKEQKITKTWDYFGATGDNIEVAWNKLKDGHPLDALKILMDGAEDPRGYTTGITPSAGLWKGGNFLKSLKDVKTFKQFKEIATNFLQTLKPAKQMKLKGKLPDGIDLNMYRAIGKRDVIAKAFRFGNAAERHQKVINAENTTKIVANLSKTLGHSIDPKDLKVVSLADGNRYAFQISYFDKATNKVYCYMADGTPNQVGEVVYGITGNIKDIKLTAGWTGKKWADI